MKRTKEIWVPCQYIREDGTIEVYSNYEVSNLGRVKSLNYRRTKKEKVLRLGQLKHRNGIYHFVVIYKDGRKFERKVHRLILSTFNPSGHFPKAVVDHINSTPSDNRLENLRWVTQQQNMSTEHFKKKMTNNKDLSKRVRVTFSDGHQEVFPSAIEVARTLHLPMRTVSIRINYHNGVYKRLNLFFEYV